jgi:N-acyl-L-homoserine lactone synthetase
MNTKMRSSLVLVKRKENTAYEQLKDTKEMQEISHVFREGHAENNTHKDAVHESAVFIKEVRTANELNDVFKLRYQIYCLEKKFEKAEDYPNELEYDHYDPYSVHFIAYQKDVHLGTARLIMPNKHGLPVEKHCNININSVCGTGDVAEISRLAVSSEAVKNLNVERSRITLGLIKQVYDIGSKLGVVYCFAAMNRALERLLNNSGINFVQAGDPVDYHGLRAPYILSVADFEKNIFDRRRDIFESLFGSAATPSRIPWH